MRAEALRAQQRVYCEPLYCVEMPAERSIDIDEELDLKAAEAIGRHFGFSLTAAQDRPRGEG
jgi:CMP-N-acetylneuraminic acid synthetase